MVVATSTTRNFTVADADNNPGDAQWFQLSGSAVLPAGAYTFKAVLGNYGNFDNAFLCASPGCLLPVKLTSFDAEINNCTTTLNWKAESETNFSKYIVEYSPTGTGFATVGIINAVSQGSAREYSFQHIPAAGKAIYRLKMVDIDGKIEYSKIVALQLNCNKSTVLVYPNPVIDFLNVNINNVGNRKAIASIYNTSGQLVFTKELVNGTNSINMKIMPSGIYNLVVLNGDEITNYKIKR